LLTCRQVPGSATIELQHNCTRPILLWSGGASGGCRCDYFAKSAIVNVA
jgi:hypothetical protein